MSRGCLSDAGYCLGGMMCKQLMNTQWTIYISWFLGPPPFRLPLIGLPPTRLPPTGLPPFGLRLKPFGLRLKPFGLRLKSYRLPPFGLSRMD